ncbi:hypothetical protein FQR65_LT00541 [Abscondita terminalis]|nr:hypothetical protein FQR65_LT00541 [Abscondita terminalis]
MKLFSYVVIFTLCCVNCRSEEIAKEENIEKSENREGKQLVDNLDRAGWRTLDREWQPSDSWVPRDNNPETQSEYVEKPATRRRRIRKRKRRPPSDEFNESLDGSSHTLQDSHDTWMEMDEDDPQKPHNRRRIIPAYASEELPKADHIYEKVRDPFTALQEVEAKSRLKKKPEVSETTGAPSIKAILKQTGSGLSLSEILQRKNLSLSDLLKGKQQAISALTEKMEMSTEPVSTTHKLISTNYNRPANNTSHHMSSTEANQQTHSTSLRNYEVITEPTTERRIFIPSNPKIIPFQYKASTVLTSSTNAPISSTTKIIRNKYSDFRSKYVSSKPKLQNLLPVTSAKLNKLSSPHQTKQEYITTDTPLKAFTINIKDLFGYSEVTTTKQTPSTEDGPVRMIINMDTMSKSNSQSSTTAKSIKENEIIKNVTKTFIKLKPLNAREEIMEVLKDQMSRLNLARILELRNMTIEELVAQRERGSSQIHLADIFHNQTKEPEPPNEPFIGTITSYMERKSKTFRNNYEESKNSDKSNLINAVDSITKPPNSATNFPTYKIAVDKILKQNEAPPFDLSVWKTLYPNLYQENIATNQDFKEIEHAQVNEVFQNEVRRIEDIENTISEAVNNKLNVEFNDENYEKEDSFMRLPSGVKSAIIASTVLVAISLLVFLTILIICKLSNKKNKRLCYSDTFSGSKIRSPILETRPKRTIRTIMNETLGRKNKYANAYPHNISDYFWDSDKKPFQ